MKREILATSILSILTTSSAFSDDISGGARANFGKNELVVPCVQVLNSDNDDLNGQYFDLVLKQKGKSLNYEVVVGVPEESETCIAAIDAMLANDDDTSDINGTATDIIDDSDEDDSDDEDSTVEESDGNDSNEDDSEDDDPDEDESTVNKGKGNNKK